MKQKYSIGPDGLSLKAAARKAGINFRTVQQRLRWGWSLDRAISEPPRRKAALPSGPTILVCGDCWQALLSGCAACTAMRDRAKRMGPRKDGV